MLISTAAQRSMFPIVVLGMSTEWATIRSWVSDNYLFGLLRAPTFLLKPEQAMTTLSANVTISLERTILISMILGSAVKFLGRCETLQGI